MSQGRFTKPVHLRGGYGSQQNEGALTYFHMAKRLLAEAETDRLQIEPRLWIKKTQHVFVITWRPNGFTENALVALDHGDDAAPTIVSYEPAGWMKILKRFYAGVINDAVAEEI